MYLQELENLNPSITQRPLPTQQSPLIHNLAHHHQVQDTTGNSGYSIRRSVTNPLNNQFRRLGAVADSSSRRQMATSRPPPHMAVPFGCHPFLEMCAPKRVAVEDLAFLEAQGCFHLPPTPVLAVWLNQYFLHVHPFIPLLNDTPFQSLWRTDMEGATSNRVSLFLFHSLLATTSPVPCHSGIDPRYLC